MDPNKLYSFPSAMLDFFGKRPTADSAAGFMAELKELTDQDKADFKEMLVGKGYRFQ